MKIFWTAVIGHPCKDAADGGVPPKLLVPPRPILATDEKHAAMLVDPPGDISEYPRELLEVIVRPF